jgi:hypothetical protein
MNIGADYRFLSLERVGQRGPDLFLRLAAAALGPGWRFTAAHERIRVIPENNALEQIADFAALQARSFKVKLRHGGWLRVRRDRHGHILVRYRVCQVSAGAAVEGEARLTGAAAEDFCSGLSEALPGRVNT